MKDNGYIYYDDSKHPGSGFYLGAFVYSDKDLNNIISGYISLCGLDPNKDEFKSSLRKDKNPKQIELRRYLKRLIGNIRIFVVIAQPNENDFKMATRNALINLIEHNQAALKSNLNIFLDQGIFKNENDAEYKLLTGKLDANSVKLKIEQDSVEIKGIQLADLVAHTCSIMLKESLGLINKTIKAGDNSGYDPDTDIEIGFEMWAGVRYNFFSNSPPRPDDWDSQLDFVAKVGKRGLFISDNCSAEIKIKGNERFGEMYLGCIH
ncbi:MAG: DUF3800 domain-containing protein [Bacteroidales bacterium]|jgi:hypothetical protein|nr:DUF3800 domain-containing protein [Bacteroidales bacterium]